MRRIFRNSAHMRFAAAGWLHNFFRHSVIGLCAVAVAEVHPAFAQNLPTPAQAGQIYQQAQQGQFPQGANAAGQQATDITLQPAQNYFRASSPPSRLEEILSSRSGVVLRQFGYDQFAAGRTVTVPLTGSVQEDYILGPGDEVFVSLRGQENGEQQVLVTRSGQVLLPRLPPIAASGRDFASVRQTIQEAVRRAYVATEAYVSVGRIRQISVLVAGEVSNPGVRNVTGLNTVLDALILSGGPKKTGTLRNIRIQRGGRTLTIDLYGVLAGQGNSANMRLTDGDRIIVQPLGRTVAVSGLVRRPAIYELPPGQSAMTVRALLSLAGGQEVRGNYRISLLQVQPDGHSSMNMISDQGMLVRDSEILFVQLGADQTSSQAVLSGDMSLSGPVPILSGTTNLSDVIRRPGAVGEAPYTLFGIISRRDTKTLLRTLTAFTPVAVMNGREDMSLQGGDIIRPLSVREFQLLTLTVDEYNRRISAELERARNPLSLRQVTGFTLSAADILEAKDLAASLQAERRSVIAASAQMQALNGPQQAVGTSGAAQSRQIGGIEEFQNLPLEGSPMFGPAQSGQASPTAEDDKAVGFPNYRPGQQLVSPMLQAPRSPAANFQDQNLRPGEFASNREITTFGDLARQLGVSPLVLVNFLNDNRVSMDGALHGPGKYFVGPNVEFQELVQAAGGALTLAENVDVEVISTSFSAPAGRPVTQRQQIALRGPQVSYIVRSRDQFHFNQSAGDVAHGTVNINGEVRYGGSYQIVRGERLSELLARAGGLTSTAYPRGTVFLRKSAAVIEHDGYVRAADEIQKQLLSGMTAPGNARLSAEAFTAVQTFVTSLRERKALGRVSVLADPSTLAAQPELDPLLEDGDVVYIPQRPSTVTVLGEVMQQGSFVHRTGASGADYIRQAGGYGQSAYYSLTFIVLPDGTARRLEEQSWLRFSSDDIPPGSTIVVPRDVMPFDLRQTVQDFAQIFSQLAVSAASIAVISRN